MPLLFKMIILIVPAMILTHSIFLSFCALNRKRGQGGDRLLKHLREIADRTLPNDLVVCQTTQKKITLWSGDLGDGLGLYWIVLFNSHSDPIAKSNLSSCILNHAIDTYKTNDFEAAAVDIVALFESEHRAQIEEFICVDQARKYFLEGSRFFDTYSWMKRSKLRKKERIHKTVAVRLKDLFETDGSCFKGPDPILSSSLNTSGANL